MSLIAALWLTGCATADSERPVAAVLPSLPHYGEAFQDQLADEVATEPLPPCDRVEIPENCAAWLTVVKDYAQMRARIKEAGTP